MCQMSQCRLGIYCVFKKLPVVKKYVFVNVDYEFYKFYHKGGYGGCVYAFGVRGKVVFRKKDRGQGGGLRGVYLAQFSFYALCHNIV